MREGTEVLYRQTVDTSIEIGTAGKGGKVKFSLTEDEVADPKKGEQKIKKIALMRELAEKELGGGKPGK